MPKQLPRNEVFTNLTYDETSPSCLRWVTNYTLRSKKGDVAGTLNRDRYWVVRLAGKLYYVHRIVIMLTQGEFDEDLHIDHKDGNKSRNFVSNLRVVTPSVNTRNRPVATRSRSGYKYIEYQPSRSRAILRWRSPDGTENKRIFKGANMEDSINFAYAYREYLVEKGDIIMEQWHYDEENHE